MDFSLGELQGQLAAALVAKYPVISQMVVQDESRPTQDAWMVSPSLTLPEEAHQAWYHQAFGGEIICRHSISISKQGDTAVRASFSGLLSPVSAFYDAVGDRTNSVNTKILLDGRWNKVNPADSAPLAYNVPVRPTLEWLSSMFSSMKMLLLGHLFPPNIGRGLVDDFRKWTVTLLLALEGEEGETHRHVRLGVMIWNLENLEDSRILPRLSREASEYLYGQGKSWVKAVGIFN